MAADPEALRVATLVVNDLLDVERFPCGNSVKQRGKWPPVIMPSSITMVTPGQWRAHGMKCLSLGWKNTQALERLKLAKESATQRVTPELKKSLLKYDQLNPGKLKQMEWLYGQKSNFSFMRDIDQYANYKGCRECKAIGLPGAGGTTVCTHAPDCKTKSKPSYGWITADLSNVSIDLATAFIESKGASLSPLNSDYLKYFRCNDHAAIILYMLFFYRMPVSYEIIRMADSLTSKDNCHYFVVVGRDKSRNFEGATAREKFGPDAILMDPWATKHDGTFNDAEVLGGINGDLSTVDKYLVQPKDWPNFFADCEVPGTPPRTWR